ncbi:transporter [Novosphingobium profundi]|uniref:transporter n=1 Tax=Novosphingobium profundi TaxID=1774954 RepID=UPI001BDAB610|nr:transporter [Novosphingobium profundi]MBT0670234.1 transporter [Novosphingobium profundi]
MDYGDYDGYRNSTSADGARQDAALDTYTATSKTAHYFDLAGHRALVSLIQPFGASRNARIGDSRLGETSGFGDTTLGLVFWPIADDAGGTNLGLAHYLTLPTGSYSPDRSVNMGGNRFVSNFQASLHQPLGGKWSTDLAADIIFYTPNSESGAARQRLTQKPAQQYQAFLNYSFDPTLTAGIGYQGWRGGKQKLDGVETGGRTDFDEVRVSLAKLVSPKLQILGEISHQTHVEGGYRQDVNALARIAYFF